MLPDIALFGFAGSGKDTVADRLVSEHGYKRISFADPLKDMALTVDPIVGQFCDEYGHDIEATRLSEVISEHGWDEAKRRFPEVRRFLQHLGQAQRAIDEDYWLNIAREAIDGADLDTPIVVTDVRYENEYKALARRQFLMVRVTRPGVGPANDHISEDVDRLEPGLTLHNGSTLPILNSLIDDMVHTYTA